MKRRVIYLVLLCGLGVSLAAYSGGSPDPQKGRVGKKAASKEMDDPVKKTILANVRSYVETFNRQDITGVSRLFSEDCDVTESDGTQVHGRKQLEEELKDTFATDPKARISVAVESLTLVTPNVAIETGETEYYPDGKTLTAEADYQVTHVKTGTRWLMRDVRVFNRRVLNPYDQLRDLEWLVGEWVDEGRDSLIESRYRWAANKAFLLQDFTVRINGQKVLNGTQRIGWDPLSKRIKAWIFDSEGGYGESLWSNVDDTWIIEVKGVRSDGKVVTATNQIEQLAKDRFRYGSVDRIVGEERLPDFQAIVVRKAPAAKD